MAKKAPGDAGRALSGEDLFRCCQRLAERRYPPAQGQGRQPSGARIFYFTLLVLLRLDPASSSKLKLNKTPLPPSITERFLALAPIIASHLAIDFKRALRLLDPQQAAKQRRRFLSSHTLLAAPRLNWSPEHLVGIYAPLLQRWQTLWRECWQQAEGEHLARLHVILLPHRLLVTSVAAASAREQAALELLREELRPATKQRGWRIPPASVFLYDEPLEDWLLRPLLSGQWLFRLCGALAELTRAVPELARTSAAAADEDDQPAPQANGRKPDPRRQPSPPRSVATAEAIFYYAVSAWRASAGAAGDEPILPDARLLAPAQFRALLALAVKAAEQLLWDNTLPLRALANQPAERQRLLRQMLLPPRLRKQYTALARRACALRASAQAAALPTWAGWEAPLQGTIGALDISLATSLSPAAITASNLKSLLLAPRAALTGQYLYQSTPGEWLRAALPADLPDVAALLQFCRELARALGEWPPGTPGAPADAEQAALAACWFCKLALEARIERPPGAAAPRPASSATNQSAEPPQRADGGLVVWLGGRLPPEALELASVAAPLIAQVLHQSSKEAARQGKPLFAARLKAGEKASRDEMTARLWARAREANPDNAAQAVLDAWDTLHLQLERLALPDKITPALLSGEKLSLVKLDFLEGEWYTLSKNCYQFLGSLASFACSFIRYVPTAREIDGEQPDEQAEAALEAVFEEGGAQADDTTADDTAALNVLTLIVQAARGMRITSTTGLDRENALILAQGLLGNNSGRRLVERFIQQGEPAARAIRKLWQASSPLARQAQPIIDEPTMAEKLELYAALARLLLYEDVQRSPQMRRAVGDLFELPMGFGSKEQAGRLPLGSLERSIALVTRESLRLQALRALDALEGIPRAQQQTLCAHLLAQQPVALLLLLLEQAGWERPAWLRPPALAAAEPADEWAILWAADDARLESAAEKGSRQNFFYGRQKWMGQVASLSASYAALARALAAEWLGVSFWSGSWERMELRRLKLFLQTLLNALDPRLSRVLGAAWTVAYRQKRAHLAEVVGLTGCLPPLLPAQLDHPAFFAAVQKQVMPDMEESSDQDAAAAARQLRRDLQAARSRTFVWFLALAGVETDDQRRILLAAMSLAKGQADRLGRWLEGSAPTEAEARLLYAEIKRWHHQTSITVQTIPDLLRSAAEQVRPVWRQLRSEPALIQRGGYVE